MKEFWVPNPWEIIQDELNARGQSYSDLPSCIQRDVPIDEESAQALEIFFGIEKSIWLHLQTKYNIWKMETLFEGKSPTEIENS